MNEQEMFAIHQIFLFGETVQSYHSRSTRTKALEFALMGELELGDKGNVYVVLTHKQTWASGLGVTFLELLKNNGLGDRIKKCLFDYTMLETDDDKLFIFMPVADTQYRLALYNVTAVYFEMGPYHPNNLPKPIIAYITDVLAKTGGTFNESVNFLR